MIDFVREWYQRHFSHPEAVLLVVLLALGFVVVFFFGKMLDCDLPKQPLLDNDSIVTRGPFETNETSTAP